MKKTTSFYELIKKLKLLTFSKLKKSVKSRIQDKIVQLTAEKNIFGRITTVRQQRNIEMRKNFLLPTWSYSLGSDRFHEYLEENKQGHFNA